RKTFYGRFPFDATGATFDDSGIWMTTNQVGPLVAGQEEEKGTATAGRARAGARRGRDPRVAAAQSRLLLARPLRRRARLLLPGARCAGTLSRGRPARSRGVALRRRDRPVVARLHPGHPGQLVRRRRNDRQPLLPGNPAGLPVPGAAAPRAVARA